MFFIFSKTAALLLLPSNILILLGVAGLVLLATRFARAGRRLLVASLALLALAGFAPIGVGLAHLLESRFPPWDASRGAPDGIIVLGGAILPRLSQDYGTPAVSADAARIIAIGKLARDYPDARIVYSGGDASLLGNEPEGNFLYPLLDSLGVPRTRVMLELRSRNTEENAVFTKALVQPKPGERWLLVTSAQHMPRAVGCFRRVGFSVEAFPVAWHTRRALRLAPMEILSGGLGRLDNAVHEWIGLVSYWLTGRTSELLPGPAVRP
ncbi:MAG: YdcF family protein [Rhizobiales bacterium]|nr:YdcF family protein [Hyphomicrobiales bacterium]